MYLDKRFQISDHLVMWGIETPDIEISSISLIVSVVFVFTKPIHIQNNAMIWGTLAYLLGSMTDCEILTSCYIDD